MTEPSDRYWREGVVATDVTAGKADGSAVAPGVAAWQAASIESKRNNITSGRKDFFIIVLPEIEFLVMDVCGRRILLDERLAEGHQHADGPTHINILVAYCAAGLDDFLGRQAPILAGVADVCTEIFVARDGFIDLVQE